MFVKTARPCSPEEIQHAWCKHSNTKTARPCSPLKKINLRGSNQPGWASRAHLFLAILSGFCLAAGCAEEKRRHALVGVFFQLGGVVPVGHLQGDLVTFCSDSKNLTFSGSWNTQ